MTPEQRSGPASTASSWVAAVLLMPWSAPASWKTSWDFLPGWRTGGKAAAGFDLLLQCKQWNTFNGRKSRAKQQRYLFVLMLRYYHYQTRQNSDNILIWKPKRVLGCINYKELLVFMAGNNHQHNSVSLASRFGKLSRLKLLPYTLLLHHISLKMKFE